MLIQRDMWRERPADDVHVVLGVGERVLEVDQEALAVDAVRHAIV